MNPKGFDYETGFFPGASAKIWDMLRAKDMVAGEKDK
jgi:hypothetical protein